MTAKTKVLFPLAVAFTVGLLTACQGPTEPTPTATVSPTPSPTITAELTSPTGVAELPYEAVTVEEQLPVELPLAPAEFSSSDDGYAMSAPKVNMPELEEWLEKLKTQGWNLEREVSTQEIYSVGLEKDGYFIFVDAVLSEAQPFTSILVSTPTA